MSKSIHIFSAPDEHVVCHCQNITKKDILAAIESGAKSLSTIRAQFGACIKKECLNHSVSCASCVALLLARHTLSQHASQAMTQMGISLL